MRYLGQPVCPAEKLGDKEEEEQQETIDEVIENKLFINKDKLLEETETLLKQLDITTWDTNNSSNNTTTNTHQKTSNDGNKKSETTA